MNDIKKGDSLLLLQLSEKSAYVRGMWVRNKGSFLIDDS